MNFRIFSACAVLCLSLSASASEVPPTYAIAYGAKDVVCADFDGDGRPDLAIACYETISVLLGNGDGTFQQPALNSPSSADNSFLVVADFNEDGHPDLATLNAILLGHGDGTFGAPAFALDWVGGAVGDLDGDGHADLVGITSMNCDDEYGCYGIVSVQRGNGDGTFTNGWASDYGPLNVTYRAHVALADFDGDGRLDAATPAGLMLGNGDGTLRSPLPCIGWSAVADFNGDGKADLVGNGDWSYTSIELGNGDGTFQSPFYTYGGTDSAVFADLNGDGHVDMGLAGLHEVSVFLGNGDGTLAPPVALETGPNGEGLAVGDFDADGRTDLARTGYIGEVSIVINDGNWLALDAPWIRVADTSVTEGNSGTRAATFVVSLSAPCTRAVSVDYATTGGSAEVAKDYQAAAGTLTIAAGQTTGTITVLVQGDRLVEENEYFTLQLSHATNAFLADGWGVASIVDDEPSITFGPWVQKAEGKRGQTTPFPVVVRLSYAYDQPVSVSFYSTYYYPGADSSDFVAKSGFVTFNPGETAKTITISVIGDNRKEPDEAFLLRFYGPSSGVTLPSEYTGGTILNDD